MPQAAVKPLTFLEARPHGRTARARWRPRPSGREATLGGRPRQRPPGGAMDYALYRWSCSRPVHP